LNEYLWILHQQHARYHRLRRGVASEFTVAPEMAGKRLDSVAAAVFSAYSRNRLQQWISDGYLTVNGQQRRARDKLVGGEIMSLQLPAEELVEDSLDSFEPEPLDIPVVFEDDHIIVINKPAGMVMHPAPGNRRGTLLNGLLYHYNGQLGVPRAGIVHRLDKETSGLCVVARTLEAHTHLVRQLQSREMGRHYTAVVIGDVPINGTIDAPIGRHPRDRKRMAVSEHGKPAITHYKCEERYLGCAKVGVKLESGRTHQIRVHMTHIGHSLIGDPVYGRRLAVLPRQVANVPEVAAFSRQALHAKTLTLVHPATEALVSFDTPMPDDMQGLCAALAHGAAEQRHKNSQV